MGMYDILLNKFKCPNCKNIKEFELQTKNGQKFLKRYRLGDKFNFNQKKLDYEKETLKYHRKPKYLIFLLGSCPKCNVYISGCAWVNPKTFIIEEINLHSYTVSIKPMIILKHSDNSKDEIREE